MAFFAVTLEEIDEVKPHPGADRLSLCKLKNMAFQFVTGLNEFSPGDEVVYFPVDSLIPAAVQERLGLVGKLSGAEKNRVKTVRLRGEVSQGIVAPKSLLDRFPGSGTITDRLGVTKYEAPVVPCKTGNLIGLPMGMSVYDIEGADRYKSVADRMMNLRVSITEKMEGSNFSAAFSYSEQKFYVNQRRHGIDGEDHDFWMVAKSQGILDFVEYLSDGKNKDVIVYGEFVGPGYQGNYYGLKNHKVFLFDVMKSGKWLSPREFEDRVFGFFGFDFLEYKVPDISTDIVLCDWLEGKTIQDASNGKSMLCDRLREGIVIRPMVEAWDVTLGSRLILKQRSPEYLAKTEN